MTGERLLVTVADGHGDRIDDLVASLESAGLSVERVLRAVGVIVGTCEPDRRSTLAGLDGVGAVEPDRELRLGPPDGPQ
ncbi:hypothetical protein ACLFMI_15915 [Pseudonocardia nantongensis]|uniref:hypothetical protein n=1 Tax=Pseudonocardia nantongensis TaxID=1181885 RepID=UPI003979D006